MLLIIAAMAAAMVACVSAAPAPHLKVRAIDAPHVLHERRESDPDAWTYLTPIPTGKNIPVRIGMTQTNLHLGHDLLMEVSQHDSPFFGQHYTAEEVIELFAPSENTINAISAWLSEAGVENFGLSANKQWMQFDTKVENLEALLKTKYHLYEHEHTGVTNVACDGYHVPAHIQEHIDYITPGIRMMTTKTVHVDKKKRMAKRHLKKGNHINGKPIMQKALPSPDVLAQAKAGSLASCGAVMTPVCVMAMYNITPPSTSVAGNSLGLFEDLAEYYAQADLNSAWETLATNIPVGTHPTCKGIDGAICEVGLEEAYGYEVALDIQVSFPLIYPQSIDVFSTDDPVVQDYYDYYGFLNNFFDGIDGSYCSYSAFGETGNSPLDPSYPDNRTNGYNHTLQCGVYKPTNVISISYGGVELDPGIPMAYQKRQCNEILKLGLQGVSVVVGSGDYGVSYEDECFGGDGYYDPGTIFAPAFPATCPYVTTIGGTTLPPGKSAAKDQETASVSFASGGGFSNIFGTASYQKSAVNHFFNVYPPIYPFYETTDNKSVGANYGVYNKIGRGFPDFSAVSENALIFVHGVDVNLEGTSMATPIFASILTRINEERLLAGKSTVGFVNPTLYEHPGVFHDITVGDNPGCDTDGFSAVPGWDPVTGLGTPKYDKMLELYMSLP